MDCANLGDKDKVELDVVTPGTRVRIVAVKGDNGSNASEELIGKTGFVSGEGSVPDIIAASHDPQEFLIGVKIGAGSL